ncbi:zinc-binding alcohol dehydrogenase family protein [Chondromyces apiculatus]|uniref:Zinc-type alcohol dehydrogenase-like protein n=1 Tax=Chondromyces apiculatus DSM 436 TaxID=1192034 RepID=A0A017TI13_9BACT|nr:zinc-binding alcohol dehydrogenase family protein [Chondromyces apiculatus]EYF08918.1 zinc-containing alcohol dehydrogenase/quinone oxidoreductase [Chondromyces apiculatus DSM 436]
MKAVALTRYLPIDDPESLLDVTLPDPTPTGRDLLVRVRAVAVNPVDTKVRSPKDKIEPSPRVLGWDAAGVVEAVGPDVTLFKAGDEVYYAGDITRPGCNSELHLIDERIVGKKPRSLGWAEAAAFPLTTLTAWECFHDRLGIDPAGAHAGRSLLIIGGGGGVGSIGIQIAKLWGLQVIATASRPESQAWCRELGADHVIDHRKPLTEELSALGIKTVDYIANFVDTAAYWDTMADLIRPQGRIVSIVETKTPVNVTRLQGKSAGFIFEMMFTRAMFRTDDMQEQHAILDAVADHIDAGRIRGTLRDKLGTINAENLRRAHAQLESGHTAGKIALEGWG